MKEEWLMPGAIVPVNPDTTKTLVDEIKRLIGVIGGMALQQAERREPVCAMCNNTHGKWSWMCGKCLLIHDKQPPTAQRERVVFPTMLRKMWSGGEVQAWLDENVNKGEA